MNFEALILSFWINKVFMIFIAIIKNKLTRDINTMIEKLTKILLILVIHVQMILNKENKITSFEWFGREEKGLQET